MISLGKDMHRQCIKIFSAVRTGFTTSKSSTYATSSVECRKGSVCSSNISNFPYVHLTLKCPPTFQPKFTSMPHQFFGQNNVLSLHRISIYKPPVSIKLELPIPRHGTLSFELPPCLKDNERTENIVPISIELPTTTRSYYEKHAARLIVIRKRKMRKHKLKKLRKKMKFEWAKVRQRREMRKEKVFQAELIAQIKEAEQFDAAQYVAEKLRKAHEVPIPKTWRGKRLPEFIIKEKFGIK